MGFQLLNLNWFDSNAGFLVEPSTLRKDWNFGSSEPPSFLAMNIWWSSLVTLGTGSYIIVVKLGRDLTRADLGPQKGSVWEGKTPRLFQKNLGGWMIIMWPDIRFPEMFITQFVGEYG